MALGRVSAVPTTFVTKTEMATRPTTPNAILFTVPLFSVVNQSAPSRNPLESSVGNGLVHLVGNRLANLATTKSCKLLKGQRYVGIESF
jgi:hypothetical protein